MANAGRGGRSVDRRTGAKYARVAAGRTGRIDQRSEVDPERICRGSSRRADARLPAKEEGLRAYHSLPDAVSHETVDVHRQYDDQRRSDPALTSDLILAHDDDLLAVVRR